jgi:hypothetical protein
MRYKGNRMPPPPRKVVIEKLPKMPPKPQPIYVERWIPVREQKKRKVIFKKSTNDNDQVIENPRNLIIQWEPPQIEIKKKVKYLGVSQVDPNEYIEMYGDTLKATNELPSFVLDIEPPNDLNLQVDEVISISLCNK